MKHLVLVLSLALSLVLTGCKQTGESASIVIPPGDLLMYNTSEFLKFSDNNYEIKLRKVTGNKNLEDIVNMTPMDLGPSTTTSDFRYIMPKNVAVDGVVVIDIVSKSNSLNWKAFVLDTSEPVQINVENTLLYDLVANYTDKDIFTYSRADLIQLQKYIVKFSQERRTLFALPNDLKAIELYKFIKNGLSSDVVFLDMLKTMGTVFNYDATGTVLNSPYPFGIKNNLPLIEEGRTTPTGDFGAYEALTVNLQMDARDPDGDRLFQYWEFLEDGSILNNSKTWSWLPSYEASRPAPYQVRAFLSDGSMIPIELNWDVLVADNNRPPSIKVVSGCGDSVTEGETWRCVVSSGDPDGNDILKFYLLNPVFPFVWPKFNGTTYALNTFVQADTLTIEWTPTNRDFLKNSVLTTLQLAVSDYDHDSGLKKNGDDVKLFNIKMIGKNEMPVPVLDVTSNGYYVNDVASGSPRELDLSFGSTLSPASNRPYDIDSRTKDKRFFFDIVIADKDNEAQVDAQKDVLTLRVNQGAEYITAFPSDADNMTQETRVLNGVSVPVTVFRYYWQPNKNMNQLVASFTPFDDMQNGQGKDFTITIDAAKRAMVPVCTLTGGTISLNQNSTAGTQSVSCPAADEPTKVVQHVDSLNKISTLLPFIQNATGGAFNFYKRLFGETDYVREEAMNAARINQRYSFTSLTAGALRISRASCTSSQTDSIIIPVGTQFRTAYTASPYKPRITYQTAVAATISKFDCEVIVPITAVNRTAAINALNVINPMTAGMTTVALTARNTSNVDYNSAATASITFTRSNTSGDFIIPAGTSVRTDESTSDSIVYWAASPITMAAGVATVTAALVRDYNTANGAEPANSLSIYNSSTGLFTSRIPAGAANSGLTWVGAPVAGVTIDHALALFPRQGFRIDQYKTVGATGQPNQYTVSYEMIDGTTPKANEISLARLPNAPCAPTPDAEGLQCDSETAAVIAAKAVAGFNDVRVRNTAQWTDSEFGDIEFYRLVNGPTLTIPAGLIVATADRKLYRVRSDVTLGASNVVAATAQRFYEATYRPPNRSGVFNYNWVNATISFSSFPDVLNINANVETAFLIEATDNSGAPLVPKDPFDRYYIYEVKVPTGADALATSKVRVCREATGACTNCALYQPSSPLPTPTPNPTSVTPYSTLNLGAYSHESSRRCYVRVSPDTGDVAKTYTMNVNMCDNGGATSITGQGCTSRDLQFYVLEPNTMPYFTGAPSALSTSGTSGAPIGSTTDGNVGGTPAPGKNLPTDSTITISTPFTETINGTYRLYSYDVDKDANNKKVQFELVPFVYDIRTGAEMAAPTGLTLTGITNYALNSGSGSIATAVISWTPNDADAKKFSSSQGIIIGVKVYDNLTASNLRKTQTIFLKARVANTNQTPVIGSFSGATNGAFTINADSYFSSTFIAADNDYNSPANGTFRTLLSACWNADGTRAANSVFDASYTGDDVCHLSGPEWGSDSYDPSSNSGPAQCKVGNVASGALNTDLVVPKITRTAGPTFRTNDLTYSFKIEWCPQKKHIGSYALGVKIFDNGDTDIQGAVAARKGGSAPLTFNVISPVYLASPQMDATGTTILKSIRQTAAGLAQYPFTYQVIAKNPRKNAVAYSILSGPAGVTIDASTGLVTWYPARTDITDGNEATNKKIVVRARDTVTNEAAQGTISLWVQDPQLFPGEQPPSLASSIPAAGVVPSVKELISYPFTVYATDPNLDSSVNHDRLFARVYVDGKIFEDMEMTREGNAWKAIFNYKPAAGDATTDIDGSGALARGQHTVQITVTDGNFDVSRSWTVNVRNTVPVPTLAFDMPTTRKGLETSQTFTNFSWTQEVAASTTLSGKLYESVYFAGAYRRGTTNRNYVWSLDFVNDVITKTGSGGNWNYYDGLTWGNTLRMAYIPDPASQINSIYLTPVTSRTSNDLSGTTKSLKIGGDLSTLPNPITAVYACSSCSTPLYNNYTDAQGSYLSVKFNNNRSIFSTGTNLQWETQGGASQNVTNFSTTFSGYTVMGMAVNEKTKRLFVSVSRSTATENRVLVYNLAPLLNATPSSPTLISNLDVSATGSWSVQGPSIPSDIAIDSTNTAGRTTYNVFVFFKGTGGLGLITDDGTTAPSSFTTIGVGSLPSSASDVVAVGRKLVYDAKNDLVIGIAREARVMYTVDPATFETVQKPTATAIDGLWIMPSGTAFLVDRANLYLYRGL